MSQSSTEGARSWPRWPPLAGFATMLLSISYFYGLVTGSPPFGTVALWEGWVRCVESGPLPCEQIGHPIGVDVNVASTVIYGVYGITRVGVSVGTALNLLAIASIGGGLASFWYLGRRFGDSHVAGAAAGVLYFASPLVLQHRGLFQLFLGFALLPVPAALLIAAITASDTPTRRVPRTVVALAAGLLVAGLVLVYLDPYPWVVATVLAAPVVVVSGFMAAYRRRWRELGLAAVLLGVLVLPGAVFRLDTAGEGLEAKMPLEFYRGMGVDVGVALLPTTASMLGDLTGVGHAPWRAIEFTGDGSQVSSSYLGLPLVLAASLGAAVLARRRDRVALVGALVVGAAVCLALSLGPSLKVVDRDPTPRGTPIVFGDYLMPAEDATLSLPWSSVYERQPVASMRATYRWQSGGRVVLTLLSGLAIGLVARRRPVLALGVAMVLVLDAAPATLWDQRAVSEADERELSQFVADMERAYGAGRLVAGERVLFLPSENDYLVQYIAPTFDVRAYNLSFDKAIAQIRPLQPPAVTEAVLSDQAGELTGEQLCGLFRDDLVDAVVFNEYSLRWDSYRWPPSVDQRRAAADDLDATGLLDTPGLEVDRGHLSVVARARAGGPCAPG